MESRSGSSALQRTCCIPAGLIRTAPDIWVPLARPPQEWSIRDFHYLRVIGRLRDGVTLHAAAAEMGSLQHGIVAHLGQKDGTDVRLVSLKREMTGDVETPLLVLLGAVFCLLLIGCVNVANLLLARGSARQREFAIRMALGAGRQRLLRQLCAEGVLLALAGSTFMSDTIVGRACPRSWASSAM